MKLYSGFSPNGARVEAFLIEKDIKIPTVQINVPRGETRSPDFLNLNSLGEIPVLQLDDGTVITETMAICRYIEALHPQKPLLGSDSLSSAKIEMWNRRIELRIFNLIGDVGRHEFPFFKKDGQVAEYATYCRGKLERNLDWLNKELADGRPFIAGNEISVADLTGMAAIMLMMMAGYEPPAELEHFNRWAAMAKARDSFPSVPAAMVA